MNTLTQNDVSTAGRQVYDKVVSQVYDQVWDQVAGQVLSQVLSQVYDQVERQVLWQVWSQVADQVRRQVNDLNSKWHWASVEIGMVTAMDPVTKIGVYEDWQ